MSGRGRNQSLYCSNGERKLPYAAQKKEVLCSHFLPWVAILFLGSFWGVWGTFFKKSPTKKPYHPSPLRFLFEDFVEGEEALVAGGGDVAAVREARDECLLMLFHQKKEQLGCSFLFIFIF